jgi:hypothetical protein
MLRIDIKRFFFQSVEKVTRGVVFLIFSKSVPIFLIPIQLLFRTHWPPEAKTAPPH